MRPENEIVRNAQTESRLTFNPSRRRLSTIAGIAAVIVSSAWISGPGRKTGAESQPRTEQQQTAANHDEAIARAVENSRIEIELFKSGRPVLEWDQIRPLYEKSKPSAPETDNTLTLAGASTELTGIPPKEAQAYADVIIYGAGVATGLLVKTAADHGAFGGGCATTGGTCEVNQHREIHQDNLAAKVNSDTTDRVEDCDFTKGINQAPPMTPLNLYKSGQPKQ